MVAPISGSNPSPQTPPVENPAETNTTRTQDQERWARDQGYAITNGSYWETYLADLRAWMEQARLKMERGDTENLAELERLMSWAEAVYNGERAPWDPLEGQAGAGAGAAGDAGRLAPGGGVYGPNNNIVYNRSDEVVLGTDLDPTKVHDVIAESLLVWNDSSSAMIDVRRVTDPVTGKIITEIVTEDPLTGMKSIIRAHGNVKITIQSRGEVNDPDDLAIVEKFTGIPVSQAQEESFNYTGGVPPTRIERLHPEEDNQNSNIPRFEGSVGHMGPDGVFVPGNARLVGNNQGLPHVRRGPLASIEEKEVYVLPYGTPLTLLSPPGGKYLKVWADINLTVYPDESVEVKAGSPEDPNAEGRTYVITHADGSKTYIYQPKNSFKANINGLPDSITVPEAMSDEDLVTVNAEAPGLEEVRPSRLNQSPEAEADTETTKDSGVGTKDDPIRYDNGAKVSLHHTFDGVEGGRMYVDVATGDFELIADSWNTKVSIELQGDKMMVSVTRMSPSGNGLQVVQYILPANAKITLSGFNPANIHITSPNSDYNFDTGEGTIPEGYEKLIVTNGKSPAEAKAEADEATAKAEADRLAELEKDPGYQVAKALSDATGTSVEDIIAKAKDWDVNLSRPIPFDDGNRNYMAFLISISPTLRDNLQIMRKGLLNRLKNGGPYPDGAVRTIRNEVVELLSIIHGDSAEIEAGDDAPSTGAGTLAEYSDNIIVEGALYSITNNRYCNNWPDGDKQKAINELEREGDGYLSYLLWFSPRSR